MGDPASAGVLAVQAATTKLGINLAPLVAEVAIWAPPSTHAALITPDNPTGARYPNVRRARLGSGEQPGQSVAGVRLDRNNYAGTAIRAAVAPMGHTLSGYHACHVWPETCYDERYHTTLANLVLVPAPLAGLTDFEPSVIGAIQFRAFELFGWHPSEVEPPPRPRDFPTNWPPPGQPSPTADARTPTVQPPRKRTQRDVMREAWRRANGDRAAATRLWVQAIERGEVERRSNQTGMPEEEYAKRLIYNGLRHGWLPR